MMNRESWVPKTVDQLRTDNNQKAGGVSILNYEGPAYCSLCRLSVFVLSFDSWCFLSDDCFAKVGYNAWNQDSFCMK